MCLYSHHSLLEMRQIIRSVFDSMCHSYPFTPTPYIWFPNYNNERPCLVGQEGSAGCKPEESEAGINHIDTVIFILSHSFVSIDMASIIQLCFKLKQDTSKTVRSLEYEDYASRIILSHGFWVKVPCILESRHFCTF